MAGLVEAVTLLTLTSRPDTHASQTRLNELAADYPTLDQYGSRRGPWRGDATGDQEVGGLVVAFSGAGDDRVRFGTAA